MPEDKMVPRRRFERPTCRLGGGCSILLSYRGMFTLDHGYFTWPGWNSQKEYSQAVAWKEDEGS